MSSFRQKMLLLACSAIFCWGCGRAQPASNTGEAVDKSPVALFRELLAMTPEERKVAIASRPPETQQRILEKLQEYEILPGNLRDLRLQETELRYYLRPLMDEAPTNRAALLAQVPENERELVEERLGLWDVLPPSLQEQFRNDEMVANYLAQYGAMTPEEGEAILKITPDRRAELEQGLDRWKGLAADQRQKALDGFNRFFALSPEEQTNALDTVSGADRRDMENTLAAYGKLTPQQRDQCIHSFEKFAAMSVAEREQFLKNAERWSKMTPGEREKWRALVESAPITPPTAEPPGQHPRNHSELTDDPEVARN